MKLTITLVKEIEYEITTEIYDVDQIERICELKDGVLYNYVRTLPLVWETDDGEVDGMPDDFDRFCVIDTAIIGVGLEEDD